MLWSTLKKWSVTMLVAFATLAVAFVSSAYTGGISQLLREFGISSEVATLGVSLFVLGCKHICRGLSVYSGLTCCAVALGPLIWAPLSELYGRQYLFIITFGALSAFNAGAAGSQNIQTLIVLRFFAGAFGSSPLTNAGGVIADLFPAAQRGVAMALFSAAPFMGPVLGVSTVNCPHMRMLLTRDSLSLEASLARPSAGDGSKASWPSLLVSSG